MTNGMSSSASQRSAVRSELYELRATCRRQALAIDSLSEAIEVRLALDVEAPGAARGVVTDCLGARVRASTLEDARLLMTELVTNSVRHSGATAGDGVIVRVDLTPSVVRLEVEDPGRSGVIAPRAADVENGGGFGLNLVEALSERWGVERVAVGGTRVWAQLARA